MKAVVRYFNRPHNFKVTNVHVVPISLGVWNIEAELSEHCEINSWESDGKGGCSVYFDMGLDRYSERFRLARIKLIPEDVDMEGDPMFVGVVKKSHFTGVAIAAHMVNLRWMQYVKRMSKTRGVK